MRLNYPVVLQHGRSGSYGVVVPDMPGCYSAGITIENSLINAKEAIQDRLEILLEDKKVIPKPSTVEDILALPEFCDNQVELVEVEA